MSAPRRPRSFPIDPYFAVGALAAVLVGGVMYARQATSASGPPAAMPEKVLTEMKALGLMESTGPAAAPVQVVEVGDYECPACASAHEKTWPIVQRYVAEGKVAFSAYDLPLPSHRNAIPAAVAAGCVAKSGGTERYWSYRDRLFAQRGAWIAAYPVEPALLRLAATTGADTAAVRGCIESEGTARAEALQKAWASASAEGVRSIPAWIVNGRTVSWPDLEAEIEKELEGRR